MIVRWNRLILGLKEDGMYVALKGLIATDGIAKTDGHVKGAKG